MWPIQQSAAKNWDIGIVRGIKAPPARDSSKRPQWDLCMSTPPESVPGCVKIGWMWQNWSGWHADKRWFSAANDIYVALHPNGQQKLSTRHANVLAVKISQFAGGVLRFYFSAITRHPVEVFRLAAAKQGSNPKPSNLTTKPQSVAVGQRTWEMRAIRNVDVKGLGVMIDQARFFFLVEPLKNGIYRRYYCTVHVPCTYGL